MHSCGSTIFLYFRILVLRRVQRLNSFNDNLAVYKRKIKSRIKSLVIPYFLWNVIVLIAFSLMFHFIKNEPIDFFLREQGVYGVLWSYHGFPIDYSLWFVRDLIVLSLLFPVFYFIVKYFCVIGLISFFILLLSAIKIPVDCLNTTAIFFFYFGTFMNIKCEWKGEMKKGLFIILAVASIVFTIVSIIVYGNAVIRRPMIKLFDTVSVILFLSLFTKLFERRPVGVVTNNSQMTFFIIAFHPIVVFCIKHIFESIVPTLNPLSLYISVFIISVASSYFSFIILVRSMPKTINCLTGSRCK